MTDTSKETVEWVAWALEHAADPEAERPTPPPRYARGVTGSEVARILRALMAERDEADRRAGAAERKLEDRLDGDIRLSQWRDEQKRSRGYHTNVSFDVVWKETCEKADRAEAALQRLADLGQEWDADQKRSFVSPSGGPSEDKPLTGPEPQPKTSEVLGRFCPEEPTP